MRKILPFILIALLAARPVFALFVPSQGNFNGNHAGSTFIAGAGGGPILGVRNDGGSVLAPFDLGYGPVAIDAQGRLLTTVTVAEQATGTPGSGTDNASAFKLVAGINVNNSTVQPFTFNDDGTLRTAASISPVAPAGHFRTDYSSGSVVTTGYTHVAVTAADAALVEVFDSSGQTLLFAVGAPGVEVDQFYIFPGGNDARLQLALPAGSDISLKAVSSAASVGENTVNLYK